MKIYNILFNFKLINHVKNVMFYLRNNIHFTEYIYVIVKQIEVNLKNRFSV